MPTQISAGFWKCIQPERARGAAVGLLASLLAATGQPAAGAENWSGPATVIDGDSIEVRGTRIRLYGIDAPERGQACVVQGNQIPCGQRAAVILRDKIGGGPVSCEQKARDVFRGVVAVCRLASEDLSQWIVSQGWALADRHSSTDYVWHEQQASQGKLGIWNGRFVAPWDWRQGKRLLALDRKPAVASPVPAQTGTAPCTIKGNISRNGRIYHMPGDAYYDRTRIDTGRGERWFCSEAEARAAGWRRARR